MSLQRDMTAKQFSMEKSKFLPTVSAFYNYTEKIKKPELDFAPKNIIGLNVNIPIFSSGKRYYSMTQAKIQLMSMQNQLELVSEQLSIQEKQLRMNLQTAYEQYQLQRNNIELARKVYNNMYVKYSQGVISGLDMTTSNSNLLQAENNYIMSVMQLLESKTAFDTFINNK
jgi:outer membrane protein